MGLEESELATLRAVADRLFPGDDESPSASALGAVEFALGQLEGDWGHGARMYRRPPFVVAPHAGHGWQSAMTPGEAVRSALRILDQQARGRHGAPLYALAPPAQDDVLRALESGSLDGAGDVGAAALFALLRDLVLEGVFCDPRHGGNRELAAWRWLGFPGDPLVHGEPYRAHVSGLDPGYAPEPGAAQPWTP